MFIFRKNGATSNVLRTVLRDDTTGAGKTGLTLSSSGLIISTITDNEAAAMAYTAAGSTIETIATLGTFAAPTATKCRFKEVDATNHPGLYEIQLADARFAVALARTLRVCITGVTGLLTKDLTIQLTTVDPDSAAFGLTNLDAAISTRLAPTTAGRTLDVSATGEAGIDWANIGSPTTAVALSGTTVGTVTAYTGNTPQTGDAFARIGVLGAGLTSVALAAAGLDAVVIEAGTNARQAISLIASAAVGQDSGSSATDFAYAGAGVATARVAGTTSLVGGTLKRTAVTLHPPA